MQCNIPLHGDTFGSLEQTGRLFTNDEASTHSFLQMSVLIEMH